MGLLVSSVQVLSGWTPAQLPSFLQSLLQAQQAPGHTAEWPGQITAGCACRHGCQCHQCCRALKLCRVPAAVLHPFDEVRLKPASQVVLELPEHILAAHAQPSLNPVQLQMTTPFPVTLPECVLPADSNKQHGLLANPYKHLVHHKAAEHGRTLRSMPTCFSLDTATIITWCHSPLCRLFLSSTLIAKYVSFHIAACHSHLYIRNCLSCAKHVLRWWQSKPGGKHTSFVEGLEWLQTLGLQVMCCQSCLNFSGCKQTMLCFFTSG